MTLLFSIKFFVKLKSQSLSQALIPFTDVSRVAHFMGHPVHLKQTKLTSKHKLA